MAALKARPSAALSPSALRFAGRVIKCYVDKQTGHVRSLRLGWSNELCTDTTLDNSEIVALHVPAAGSVAALPANVTGDGAVGSLTFQVSGPYSEEVFTCGRGAATASTCCGATQRCRRCGLRAPAAARGGA